MEKLLKIAPEVAIEINDLDNSMDLDRWRHNHPMMIQFTDTNMRHQPWMN